VVADIEKMNNLKVMVIGDTIIDEYHYCNPLGKSSKSPTISTIFLRSETFAGGVLAIANHLEQLAGSVKLVTCLGKENTASSVIDKTLSKGVDSKFFTRNDGPTPVKRRYLDRYQNVKLFEVTFMNDRHIDNPLEKEVIQYLNKEIPKYDLVVITDFGHGFITPELLNVSRIKPTMWLLMRRPTVIILVITTLPSTINPITYLLMKKNFACLSVITMVTWKPW